MNKTNAMRQLERAGIAFEPLYYTPDENDLSGTHIASQVGLSPDIVFKTLVARGDKKGISVFCIPADRELDLKAAAALTGDKRLEMVAVKDLLATVGYMRGACSPVGMKKVFPTYIDESAQTHERITVSAGVRGCQLLLSPHDIIGFTKATVSHLTKEA